MRVLLAGGGSGGSATPILAVATELRERVPDVELLYVGTHAGPEAELAAEEGIPYVGVATGKYNVDALRAAGADYVLPTLESPLPRVHDGPDEA